MCVKVEQLAPVNLNGSSDHLYKNNIQNIVLHLNKFKYVIT